MMQGYPIELLNPTDRSRVCERVDILIADGASEDEAKQQAWEECLGF